MERYVYIESKASNAFQFLKFDNESEAKKFCKNVMISCNTLRAKIVEGWCME